MNPLLILPGLGNNRFSTLNDAQDHSVYDSFTAISIDGHNGLCDRRKGGYIGLYGAGEY